MSQNVSKYSFSYVAALASNHAALHHKVRNNAEQRGKSNIQEVKHVMRKIAIKDLDYLKEKLTEQQQKQSKPHEE